MLVKGRALCAGQTALYEDIGRHDALWTFDITASTWTKRQATGDLPDPHLANGLTVANGKAYALVNDPDGTKRLEVYELDLERWDWRLLPPLGTQPTCRRATSAVVMKVLQLCGITAFFLQASCPGAAAAAAVTHRPFKELCIRCGCVCCVSARV